MCKEGHRSFECRSYNRNDVIQGDDESSLSGHEARENLIMRRTLCKEK